MGDGVKREVPGMVLHSQNACPECRHQVGRLWRVVADQIHDLDRRPKCGGIVAGERRQTAVSKVGFQPWKNSVCEWGGFHIGEDGVLGSKARADHPDCVPMSFSAGHPAQPETFPAMQGSQEKGGGSGDK